MISTAALPSHVLSPQADQQYCDRTQRLNTVTCFPFCFLSTSALQEGLTSCWAIHGSRAVQVKMFEATGWELIESPHEPAVVRSQTDPNSGLTILKVNEFDHARMTMSVIVKDNATGELHVFCKVSCGVVRMLTLRTCSCLLDVGLITWHLFQQHSDIANEPECMLLVCISPQHAMLLHKSLQSSRHAPQANVQAHCHKLPGLCSFLYCRAPLRGLGRSVQPTLCLRATSPPPKIMRWKAAMSSVWHTSE